MVKPSERAQDEHRKFLKERRLERATQEKDIMEQHAESLELQGTTDEKKEGEGKKIRMLTARSSISHETSIQD